MRRSCLLVLALFAITVDNPMSSPLPIGQGNIDERAPCDTIHDVAFDERRRDYGSSLADALRFDSADTESPVRMSADSAGAAERTQNNEPRAKDKPPFSIRFTGFVQADFVDSNNDEASTGESTPLESDADIRRGRIAFRGDLSNNWHYKLDYDLAVGGTSGIRDVSLEFSGLGNGRLIFGNSKEPFSLNRHTSSRVMPLMERPMAVDALSPQRSLGITWRGSMTERIGAHLGLYTDGPVSSGGMEDGDTYITARLIGVPLLAADQKLHLGFSGTVRKQDNDKTVRFRARPESRVAKARLIDTGDIGADGMHTIGLEAAYTVNAFTFRGEWLFSKIDRISEGALRFNGYYATATWSPTGTPSPYSRNLGRFEAPEKGWDLALRYSVLDLNDKDITGGKETNLGFGVTWRPSTKTRVAAEFIKVLDIEGGEFDGASPSILQLRLQYQW